MLYKLNQIGVFLLTDVRGKRTRRTNSSSALNLLWQCCLAAWLNSAFPIHLNPCYMNTNICVTAWHTTWGNCSGWKITHSLGCFSFGSISLLVDRAVRLFATCARLQQQKHHLNQGLLWKGLVNCNLTGSMCCRWERLNFGFLSQNWICGSGMQLGCSWVTIVWYVLLYKGVKMRNKSQKSVCNLNLALNVQSECKVVVCWR